MKNIFKLKKMNQQLKILILIEIKDDKVKRISMMID